LINGLDIELSPAAVLVFSATIIYYNFHDISARMDFSSLLSFKNSLNKGLLSISEIVLISICFVFFTGAVFFLHPNVLILVSLIAALSILYSIPLIPYKGKWIRIREILYFKLSIVAFCWALMAVLLPLFEAGVVLQTGILYIQLIAVALFIFALCIPFEIRDIALEKSRGLRTIPIVYGIRVARISALIALLISAALYIYLFTIGTFPVYILAALLISTTSSIALIFFSSDNPSDFYCKFYIDGMMVFQFVLVFLSLSL